MVLFLKCSIGILQSVPQFTTNCNPLYPNALELQNGSFITYSWLLELIDKPHQMHNHSVNVNWSSTAPMEGLFNELSKTFKILWHSRSTKTRREVLLGKGGLYEHETIEYFKMEFRYRHHCTSSYFFNYLGSNVKQILHVAKKVIKVLMTVFICLKTLFVSCVCSCELICYAVLQILYFYCNTLIQWWIRVNSSSQTTS